MNNKKFAALLALIKTKKFIIPAAFMILLAASAGVLIKASFNIETKPDVKGLTIDASLNFNAEDLQCEADPKSLQVDIINPNEGAEFFSSDALVLEANYTYSCKNEPQFEFAWRLDDSETPFSNEKNSATLNDLPAGNHKIKYSVFNAILGVSKEVNFKVADKIVTVQCNDDCDNTHLCPGGLSCSGAKCVLDENPRSAICKPNQAPTSVTILYPENGGTYEYDADYCENLRNNRPCLNFSGTAQDPEDGELSGGNLEWYYELLGENPDQPDDYGQKTYFGVGSNPQNFVPAGYSGKYKITLKAVDNNGAAIETSIEVTIYHNGYFRGNFYN